MVSRRYGLALGLAGIVLAVSAGLTTRAQEHRSDMATPTLTIKDALDKPYTFPFADETPLSKVAEHLRKTLKARIVIDRAALDRLGLETDDTVQLELDGARLKVGLKLLLDQLEMTFHVEPEDNLLVLTDSTGSVDPIDRVITEIKALHRDVHDIQDALEDVLDELGINADEGGVKMRKPTLIEEVPEKPGDKSKEQAAPPIVKPDRPGV